MSAADSLSPLQFQFTAAKHRNGEVGLGGGVPVADMRHRLNAVSPIGHGG
jgi:hypothetical protein